MIEIKITATDANDLSSQVKGLAAVMGGAAAPVKKTTPAGSADPAPAADDNPDAIDAAAIRALSAIKVKEVGTDAIQKLLKDKYGGVGLSKLKATDFVSFYADLKALKA